MVRKPVVNVPATTTVSGGGANPWTKGGQAGAGKAPATQTVNAASAAPTAQVAKAQEAVAQQGPSAAFDVGEVKRTFEADAKKALRGAFLGHYTG